MARVAAAVVVTMPGKHLLQEVVDTMPGNRKARLRAVCTMPGKHRAAMVALLAAAAAVAAAAVMEANGEIKTDFRKYIC